MMSPRLTILASAAFGLSACSSSTPDCVDLTPLHATSDGVAEVTTEGGEVLEEALKIQTVQVAEAPPGNFAVGWTVICDDQSCPVTVECEPEQLDAGDLLVCTVTDDSAVDAAACQADCDIDLTLLSAESDDYCNEVQASYALRVLHEPQ